MVVWYLGFMVSRYTMTSKNREYAKHLIERFEIVYNIHLIRINMILYDINK